jgi:Protein of unknown function (DUF3047)
MRLIRSVTTLLLGAATVSAVLAADEASIAAFSGAVVGEPPKAWSFATLPRKQPTKFTVVDLGGAHVLKVEAEDSYGNLVHGMHAQPSERSVLSWRWRVDKLVDEADLKVKSGDDSPAKLCVFFAFDTAKLSLGERTRLSMAQSITGQDVPGQTLCYVWDNKLPVDTAMNNAFSKRIRMIVLDSGSAKLGQWTSQRRHLVADYQRLFGDESDGKVPEVVGIAISADADNTHGHALAYFGDVTLTP